MASKPSLFVSAGTRSPSSLLALCPVCYSGRADMFHHGKTKRSSAQKGWRAQRIVAFFFSLLVVFIVLDPLWECHDHLDNLRHLGGAHAALLILLIVACAGISLLKSFSFLPTVSIITSFRGAIPSSRAARACDGFAQFAGAASLDTAALPLRI